MTQPHPKLLNTTLSMYDSIIPEKLLELNYWERILHLLQASLAPDLRQKIHFHLLFGNGSLRVEATPGIANVFIIADEEQTPRPELYDGETIVFQSSYSKDIFGHLYNNIYPFPIGYNSHLDLESPVPFAKRTVNVFFSGNLHRGRQRMFNYYSRLRFLPFSLQHRLQARVKSVFDSKYPSSYLRFTNGFMRGLNFSEYAQYIKDSKIVLSPHGSTAEECFRHYEAIKCGSIVISERLPDNYFLSDSPIIQIDNWAEGDRIIRQLLSDPARMQALHQATLAWWQNVLSEQAVASYMRQILERELAPALAK